MQLSSTWLPNKACRLVGSDKERDSLSLLRGKQAEPPRKNEVWVFGIRIHCTVLAEHRSQVYHPHL